MKTKQSRSEARCVIVLKGVVCVMSLKQGLFVGDSLLQATLLTHLLAESESECERLGAVNE